MPADPQQISQAIHDLIYDSLTRAPAGSQPAVNPASTLLSLSVPGLPLDPAEFTNPWTPLNPGGNPATAENFAWLVDSIPQVSAVFVPNGNSIETLYGQIVQANTPETAPVAPIPIRPLPPVRLAAGLVSSRVIRPVPDVAVRQAAFKRLFTEVPLTTPQGSAIKTLVETPALRKYLDLRAAREEAVTRYMSQLLQADMSDPAQKQRWEARSAALKTQVQSATQAAEAEGAGEIEDALSSVAVKEGDGQNNSVAAIFSTARLNFELSKLGSVLGPGYTWHMTLAQPQNWFTPEASFFDVDLRTSRALPLNSQSRFQQLGGLAELNAGAWGYRAQDKALRRPIARESIDIRVRFKFARVAIRRPWLDFSLLSLGGWAMAGRHRNDLSNGSLTGNPGIFPLLPVSLIIARDLQISATWSKTDVAFIRERLAQKDLAFGPFALSGQYQRPRAQAPTVAQASFDGVNISAPGLQVIGSLSQLVPACPPLDG